MSELLDRFLTVVELDDLADARLAITEMSRDDAARVTSVVTDGDDEQAVVNLLMYPELLPEAVRNGTVLEAIDGPTDGYRVLAAVRGVVRIDLEPEQRRRVARQLLDLAQHASAPTSTLATRGFGAFTDAVDVQVAVERLGELRADERHNLLAGLVKSVAIEKLREALAFAEIAATMSPDDIEVINARLDEAEADPNSPVRIALLSYQPNLADWDGSR